MDLELARAELATSKAKLAADQGAFDDAIRSLEVLVGRYPKAELEVATTLPALPPPAPAGLPSDLLERRPDVVAADRRVAAAFNAVQSTKAARLPRVAITAGGGVASGSLSALTNPASLAWNIGANLVGPLIDGGRLDAEVEITEAQQQTALANYVKVAQTALLDVETALSGETVIRSRLGFVESSTTEFGKAADIARKQFDAGVSDVLRLNQILRQSFQAEAQLVALQGEQLIQRVMLHAALGGDFGDDRIDDEVAPTP
jgi:outer membrane protein TolC